MTRAQFIKIMNMAIERIETNEEEFSCVAITKKSDEDEVEMSVRNEYADCYEFGDRTMDEILNFEPGIKLIRLIALEYYKEMMLGFGLYKEL